MKFLGRLLSCFVVVLVLTAGGIFLLFRLGAKPKDLGIEYTEKDLQSGKDKSQIVYESTASAISEKDYWQTFGKREINTAFSSAEATAIMNNKPGIYYPYKDVQVKFNADGTAEISGRLIKERIPVYAATFDAPQIAVDIAMKILPENPVFYLKGRASLENNEVGLFEPMRFELGRIPLPLEPILAQKYGTAYAADINSVLSEISEVHNKRQLIIDFINSRLANIQGFYAKKAYFEEDKLFYEGTLPEREVTVRE